MHTENGSRKYPYDFTAEPEGSNDGPSHAADLAVEADRPIYAACWNNGKRSVYKVFPSRIRQLDTDDL